MSAPYTSPLAQELAGDVEQRFVRYARVFTTSDRLSSERPSTARQLDLSRILVDELLEMGLSDAAIDPGGYVFATLPATIDGDAPTIGLLAHVDTSPDAPGEGVEPIVHRDYDGGVIRLPRNGTVLDPADLSELTPKVGHDLITSSGDTLLGADDKAGVAEIMSAVAYLAAHPERRRPTLRISFPPDEEVGLGGTLLDLDRFQVACAYTLDGSEVPEIQDETFTGKWVRVTIDGVMAHPGMATGKLVNAAVLAGRVVAGLPPELTPEATSGRQGFLHVATVSATGAHAEIELIARDFDDDLLDQHVEVVRRVAEEVVGSAPRARLNIEVTHQYSNLRSVLDRFPQVTAAAEEAARAEGLEPRRASIRGGTDGATLSARGVPTPNLYTGAHEFHSEREWASVQDMATSAATVVHLAEVWTRPEYVQAARAWQANGSPAGAHASDRAGASS